MVLYYAISCDAQICMESKKILRNKAVKLYPI